MTADDVRRYFLEHLGIRIGPAMADYALRRLRPGATDGSAAAGPFAVMGGDARTGVALRRFIDPASLVSDPVAMGPAAS